MPIFEVGRREVHIQYIEIEADSPEAAIKAVCDGTEWEETYFEFSHCLDCNLWTAEETKGE